MVQNSKFQIWPLDHILYIRKTCPRNVYPLKPHLYTVKLGCAGVYLFFLFLLQNIDCGYSLEPTIYVLSKNKKNIIIFPRKIFIFYNFKNLCILHGHCFRNEGPGTPRHKTGQTRTRHYNSYSCDPVFYLFIFFILFLSIIFFLFLFLLFFFPSFSKISAGYLLIMVYQLLAYSLFLIYMYFPCAHTDMPKTSETRGPLVLRMLT